MSIRANWRGLSSLVVLAMILGGNVNLHAGNTAGVNMTSPHLDTDRKHQKDSAAAETSSPSASTEAAARAADAAKANAPSTTTTPERSRRPLLDSVIGQKETVGSLLESIGFAAEGNATCALTNHRFTAQDARLIQGFEVDFTRKAQEADIAMDGNFSVKDDQKLQEFLTNHAPNLSEEAQRGALVLMGAIAEKAKTQGYVIPGQAKVRLQKELETNNHETLLQAFVWENVTEGLLQEAGWSEERIDEFQQRCSKAFIL